MTVLVLGIAEQGFSFSRTYEKDDNAILYLKLCKDAQITFEQIFIIDKDFNVEIYPEL